MATDYKNSAPAFAQPESALKRSADLSRYPMAPTAAAQLALPAKNTLRDSKALLASTKDAPPVWTCKQCLQLSFFFDGTGNNMESDLDTMEHSNVVRLFLAHVADDEKVGISSIYIPGLGTYFKEIGDAGGPPGLGLAVGGQARLDWALKQFNMKVERRQNNTRSIKVSVFGFSRGAASARAFCRELAKRCEPCTDPAGTGFKLKNNGLWIEINFLGLFDTVASVGLAMAANNAARAQALETGADAVPIFKIGKVARGTVEMLASNLLKSNKPHEKRELYRLAFGEGGVDPAPGLTNGHASWADDLKIPPLVKRCVHMMASHEVRNSFPVDSTANGIHYPMNVEEMVYPGAHSDVGGGYRPREEARAPHYGEMLSLIPLHAMYERARQAGVPLVSLDILSSHKKKSFAVDAEGARHFQIVYAHFTHYMNTVGWGGGNLGKDMLTHLKMFYRWRFMSIRRREQTRNDHGTTDEEKMLARNEQEFSKERAALEKNIEQKTEDLKPFELTQRNYEIRLQESQLNRAKFGTPVDPALENKLNRLMEKINSERNAISRDRDKLRTAANDSKIAKAAERYDKGLMEDAEAIRQWMREDKTLKLRPHYQALVDAYEAAFAGNDKAVLRDEKIIAFFDRYVHDSLAGFDTDLTRRSDPRVVYVGGNNKLLA
jgi:hypothetical protein